MESDESDESKEASTRGRILGTATELFSRRGFEGTRMDAVAEQSGANKAMIYYHFDDKEDLYQAVLNQLFEALTAELDRLPDEPETPPRVRLEQWLLVVVRHVRSHPNIAKLLLREIVDGGRRLSADTREYIRSIWGYFRSLLAECRETHECVQHPIINIQRSIAGMVLMNSLDTPFFEVVTGTEPESEGISDEDLVDLFLSGLSES